MEPEDYERFPGFDDDPKSRHFNLWTYIDARDAAQAIRLALESKIKGAEVFGIANADSVMPQSMKSSSTRSIPRPSASGRSSPMNR